MKIERDLCDVIVENPHFTFSPFSQKRNPLADSANVSRRFQSKLSPAGIEIETENLKIKGLPLFSYYTKFTNYFVLKNIKKKLATFVSIFFQSGSPGHVPLQHPGAATGIGTVGPGVGAPGLGVGVRHLSPNFPSAVPRHGSLPNVNAAMGIQVRYYSDCSKEVHGQSVDLFY